MKKFIASLIISFTLLTLPALAYDDVAPDSPYYTSVEYLQDKGVFPDTPEFKPDLLISKAEFVKYMVLLRNSNVDGNKKVSLPFTDTQNNAWYAPYLDEAIQLGIIQGGRKAFEPYRKLMLVQALELLFQSKSLPIPQKYPGEIPYRDVKNSKQFGPLVMRAIELNLFPPQKSDYAGMYRRLTRGLAAQILFGMEAVQTNSVPSAGKTDISALEPELQKILTSWDLITNSFYDKKKIDKEYMSDAAIRALAEQVDDPYTTYLDRSANGAFSDDLDGEIEGIGAYVGYNEDEKVTIITPMADSPAEQAGLKAGDVIEKVDGVDISGMDLQQAVNLIKGPKGTKVRLTIRRNGSLKYFDITRDLIIIKALEYDVIGDGKVMYVKLSTFNDNASREFRDVVNIIENSKEIQGMVLDMRDNPGGLLDASVRILNYLLPQNSPAVTIEYNYFSYSQYAMGNQPLGDLPIVVLINKGSASAAEIVAGAMQDYGVAKIVGEKSFGKGTVQEVNYFLDGSSLKLTVAKWLTPNDRTIQGNGIEPDVTVKDVEGTQKDEILDRGLQELYKLIDAR